MSSWMHGHAVRCGPLTHAAQIFSASLGHGGDAPQGPAGLLALAHAVERYLAAPDTDDEHERVFVELAGAYLAVLICDAMPDCRHAMRDGKHGLMLPGGTFFDPFAAMARVLQADQVRMALAREVARAELRARDGKPDETTWQRIRAHVLPRLVGPTFAKFIGERFERAPVHVVPLAGEAQLAFIVREGHSARYVRHDEIEHAKVDSADLMRAALKNLARQSERARLMRCDSDQGVLVVAKSGDGLDSSRLLLPGLHDVLAPELGSPFAAAVPHRDALLACPLSSPAALDDLRKRAEHEAARASHRITPQLFSVGPGGQLALIPAQS